MYIARQPIFDKTQKVYGYELLFRNSMKASSYQGASAESSTAVVLGGLFELGLDRIVGGKRAFVNFDYHFLMSKSIELIDPSSLVIETLENIQVDQPLLDRIAELRAKGYRIALDDFAENLKDYPIVPLADIIKYDILLTPLEKIEEEVKYALSHKKVLLAEKIETEKEFELAKKMGFHLFQGYFFSKPAIVGGLKGRKSDVGVYQRLVSELKQEYPSFQKLTEIIETDVNLAYRMMKAVHGKNMEDSEKTIKNALTNMGLLELERWIHVLMLQDLSTKKPQELTRLSLVRAKFGEYVASESKEFRNRKFEISLMCMFSVLDAMLDMPMETALEDVAVSRDVKEALVHRRGKLEPFLALIECYDRADWEKLRLLGQEIHINTERMLIGYLEAISWAERIVNSQQ